MIVMKFGGTSVANAERIRAVRDIVAERLERKPIVISSALGKTTDHLIAAGKAALDGTVEIQPIIDHHTETAEALGITSDALTPLFEELTELVNGIKQIQEISPRTSDYLVSFGERLAIRIIAEFFSKNEVKAKALDSWEIGILTDGKYQAARLLPDAHLRIRENLGPLETNYDFTPVITGYIGKSPVGSITTFGRGGSDLTATTLGAALAVEEVQVWKDVSGLMTADPRVIKKALPVPQISFEEASELATFGGTVLHPLSMRPALEADIPVRVKNSYAPADPGTIITAKTDFTTGPIKSITKMRDVTLVDIISLRALGACGFLAKVFNVFDKHGIVVDVLASSEVSISLTVDNPENISAAAEEIAEFARIEVLPKHAIISTICDAQNSALILCHAFNNLNKATLNPKMLSQGASKLNISMVFEDSQAEAALEVLHDSLLELRNS